MSKPAKLRLSRTLHAELSSRAKEVPVKTAEMVRRSLRRFTGKRVANLPKRETATQAESVVLEVNLQEMTGVYSHSQIIRIVRWALDTPTKIERPDMGETIKLILEMER